jgi:hypothetical protein
MDEASVIFLKWKDKGDAVIFRTYRKVEEGVNVFRRK